MNTTYKILLVDDEPDIIDFLGYNLRSEGFEVYSASTGKEAIEVAKAKQPHLIVLDIMMPGMDGMETCSLLRSMPETKDTLIAFLTARGEDYSMIAGFETGADDYITKPIKPRVFVSRVKALLRRFRQKEEENKKIEVGDIKIDLEKITVYVKGREQQLPKKEFELLVLLASKPGKVFNREEILNNIWGNDIIVGNRTIDVHIRKLREKLGNEYIKTVKGIGYKLEF